MINVLTLRGKSHIAVASLGFYGKRVLARKRAFYDQYFKYQRINEESFAIESEQFWKVIVEGAVYEYKKFNELLSGTITKPEEPKVRDNKPISGDYVQLMIGGIITEDFTFVKEMVDDNGDVFVIKDIMEKSLKVIPLPERDNGPRKAFRMIL